MYLACNCTSQGSNGIACDRAFQCRCKANFKGLRCNTCNEKFYGFPSCKSCQCNVLGSVNSNCGSNGKCSCKSQYKGDKCNQCADGFNRTQTGECISRKFSFTYSIVLLSQQLLTLFVFPFLANVK